MCNLKNISRFLKNGAAVFSDASRGQYRNHSKEISKLREEIFGCNQQKSDDKKNLRADRVNIERDVRKSFDEYLLIHG